MAAEDDYEARYAQLCRTHRDWPVTPPTLTACPTDVGTLPIAGACSTCQKCLRGNGGIWFKMK
jgi:hypothetical protein